MAVLLCGQELRIHRIERDEEIISRLVVLEARFWEHVINDIEPPADGSESAARALRSLYPGKDTVVDFSQDPELVETFTKLISITEAVAEQEQQAELLKQTLQQAMGDASIARFGSLGEVIYRRSKDASSLDTKRLAAEHPEIATAYTVVRPGSRRFRINTTIKEVASC